MVDRVLADRQAATQGSPHVPSYQKGTKDGPAKAVVRTVPRIVLNAYVQHSTTLRTTTIISHHWVVLLLDLHAAASYS
jgi:hypothetical protein